MNRFVVSAAALAALLSSCARDDGSNFPERYSLDTDARGATLVDPSWITRGAMATAREKHTATLLPSGKVLVVGGSGPTDLASAELYDPPYGTWTETGPLATGRFSHSATLLQSGKVLVVGGFGPGGRLSSAELYDPESGTWSATGSLATARYLFTSTLLPDGKVLVTGGLDASPLQERLASSELYDPASGTWSATGSLSTARYNHAATLLESGKVLVSGGYGSTYLAGAELFDPANGTWSDAGSLATARSQLTATTLSSGKVLVTGGYNGARLASAELYDPTNGTWSATGPLAAARDRHTATLLPSGKVIVAGGWGTDYLAGAELYDPALGSWSSAGSLTTARLWHTATVFPSGKVLFAGGSGTFGYLASAELYAPSNVAPVAQSQTLATAEDTSVDVTLLGTDADGDLIAFTIAAQPAHGTLTGSGASLTYTPAPDYYGPDGFTFSARDGLATSTLATVSLTVTPVNDAPVAQAGEVALNEDAPTEITLGGDDVDGDALTYTVVGAPAHGTLSGSGASRTYAPAADYAGSDGFTFLVNDGTVDSSVATVSLTVAPVNDAPVATPQSVSAVEGQSIAITLAGTDVELDALTYSVVTPPAHGALDGTGASLTYTSSLGYTGPDSFTFSANDGLVSSVPTTVSITVARANEPAEGGCSCGTPGEVAPLALLFLGVLPLRRRRRAR